MRHGFLWWWLYLSVGPVARWWGGWSDFWLVSCHAHFDLVVGFVCMASHWRSHPGKQEWRQCLGPFVDFMFCHCVLFFGDIVLLLMVFGYVCHSWSGSFLLICLSCTWESYWVVSLSTGFSSIVVGWYRDAVSSEHASCVAFLFLFWWCCIAYWLWGCIVPCTNRCCGVVTPHWTLSSVDKVGAQPGLAQHNCCNIKIIPPGLQLILYIQTIFFLYWVIKHRLKAHWLWCCCTYCGAAFCTIVVLIAYSAS